MQWKIEKRTDADLIAQLLRQRGITAKEQFFNPPHPASLTWAQVGLEKQTADKAVARIYQACQKRERIVVYGDYDVDGVSATAILWEALHTLGADVLPYIPDRKREGYGFSLDGIKNILAKHTPNLVISVDHGITGGTEIAHLVREGVDVIVTDHHQAPAASEVDILRKHTQAILHTTQLSGAGIAWYLANLLLQKQNDEQLGLAALGTVADLLPLVGANRQIVCHGLKALTNTQKTGLRALKAEAGIEQAVIEPYHIGYILGPRLNAAGRMEHARAALRLLCTNNEMAARSLAQKLGRINQRRQKLLADQLNFSLANLKQAKILPPLLILSASEYEEGIIGLIAGRLAERYWRPAIVIAQGENGLSKASARSIPGVNIIALIQEVKELLISSGGHPLAAGFTVATEALPTVAAELLQIATDRITKEQLRRVLQIDAEIGLNEATRAVYDILQKFAPYGIGNPQPLFCTRGVYLENVRTVGADGKHLKFTTSGINAIAFGHGYLLEKLNPTAPVDLAYHLNLNHWNGRDILQLKVREIKQN